MDINLDPVFITPIGRTEIVDNVHEHEIYRYLEGLGLTSATIRRHTHEQLHGRGWSWGGGVVVPFPRFVN